MSEKFVHRGESEGLRVGELRQFLDNVNIVFEAAVLAGRATTYFEDPNAEFRVLKQLGRHIEINPTVVVAIPLKDKSTVWIEKSPDTAPTPMLALVHAKYHLTDQGLVREDTTLVVDLGRTNLDRDDTEVIDGVTATWVALVDVRQSKEADPPAYDPGNEENLLDEDASVRDVELKDLEHFLRLLSTAV